MNCTSEVVLPPPRGGWHPRHLQIKMAPSAVDTLLEKGVSVSCYRSKPTASGG